MGESRIFSYSTRNSRDLGHPYNSLEGVDNKIQKEREAHELCGRGERGGGQDNPAIKVTSYQPLENADHHLGFPNPRFQRDGQIRKSTARLRPFASKRVVMLTSDRQCC